jgi:hypothetical protein
MEVTMKDLIERKQQLENEIDEINSIMNQQVHRVLVVFFTQKFKDDKEFRYSTGSASSVLIGNHLHAQVFDTFQIEDGILKAGGMYQGARSYYEYEGIRFPVAWLSLSDEALGEAMQQAWEDELTRLRVKKENDEEAAREKRREQFEKLKQEFADVAQG